MKTFRTMLKNEMKLSLRDMNMVIFAICIPLVVLIYQFTSLTYAFVKE